MQTHKDNESLKTFPRAVYKKGTGKALDDSGKYEAESKIVKNEEELKALGGDWVETPVDAATGADATSGAHPKHGSAQPTEHDEAKHGKKAKH